MENFRKGKGNIACACITLDRILDDLCVRFLVNLPATEFESFERLFFSIESAHWFYEDFYRPRSHSIPRLSLKQFAEKIFDHTSLLRNHRHNVKRLITQFRAYKNQVPSCGAALLNPAMDKVLMVKSWGSDGRWSLPKGKIFKGESMLDCAIREVLEETGFDITPSIGADTIYADTFQGRRSSRIFLIMDVPEDSEFRTKTRKEISDIKWIPLSALPKTQKDAKIEHTVLIMSTGQHRVVRKQNIKFAQLGVPFSTLAARPWMGKQWD